MDARTFLGMDPVGDDLHWRMEVTPELATPGDFLFGGCGLGAGLVALEAAAQLFAGWARGAQSAVVDGRAGAVWAPGGHVRSVFVLHVVGDRIVTIDVIADPDRIGRMALTF